MRLVPDWRQAWRWNSMHAMGGTGILISAWEALPNTMKQDFPVRWVIALAIVMLAMGVVGRLRDQNPPQPEKRSCTVPPSLGSVSSPAPSSTSSASTNPQSPSSKLR